MRYTMKKETRSSDTKRYTWALLQPTVGCSVLVENVEAMDVWEAAAEMQRLRACCDGTATMEDLTGSTFTITASLGRDGGLGATSIINHPEVGILGVHKARDMPVVQNGQITICQNHECSLGTIVWLMVQMAQGSCTIVKETARASGAHLHVRDQNE